MSIVLIDPLPNRGISEFGAVQIDSKVVALSWQEQVQMLTRRFKLLLCGGGVDPYGWKGVIVEAKDFIAPHKFGGLDRIIEPHGEIIADTQGSEGKPGGFSDQLHVHS